MKAHFAANRPDGGQLFAPDVSLETETDAAVTRG
jgi:hypothetical protein